MPLRGGESVGQAYVRIYADGAEVPGDIRRMLEDAEPSVMEQGKRHGETYSKSFVTEFGKSKEEMFGDIDDAFLDSLDRLSLSDDFFKSNAWRDFVHDVQVEFPEEMGDAARLAMKKIEAEFRDTGNLDMLASRMRNIGVDVRSAQKDILDAFAEQDRQRSNALKLQERDLLRNTASFKNSMAEVAEQVQRLASGLPSDRRSALHVMLEDLRQLAPTIAENDHDLARFNLHIADTKRQLDNAHPSLRRWHNTMDNFGTSIGRLFGKGSRNNFLNFLGSVVGGLIRFPTKVLFTIAEGFSKFGNSIAEAFTKAGGGAAGVFKGALDGFAQLGLLAAKAAAAVVAFGAILVVLGAIIGPIVSILSGLVGILTALASSLVFAAGSLAAFLPLIIPVAAIIAGVVAAVMDLNGATGALGKTMDEISDKSTRLWDRFKTGVGDSEGLRRVLAQANRVLGEMTPLVDAAIKGFNRFAGEIAKEMAGGAIDKFINRFARFLPNAMKDLGTIFGNIFGGLAGLLRGLAPSANRLLDWLVKITDQFDRWANSRKGQREIKQFMEDASESASALGGFLEEVWGFLKKIIESGKDTGDNIFSNMADDFERWTTWLEDHPDALTNWFAHAEQTAEDVGHLVDSINHLIDDLDTADNRKTGSEFLNGLADALELITTAAETAQFAIHALTDPAQLPTDFGNLFNFDMDAVNDKIAKFIRGMGARVAELWKQYAPDLDLDFGGISRSLGQLRRTVRQGVSGAVGEFRGMAGRAAQAAGDIAGRVMGRMTALPGRVLNIVNQIVARFGNIAERIARTIGDLWGAISSRFLTIIGNVARVIDDIVALFRGLAGRILAMIGPIVIHPTIGSITGGRGSAQKMPDNSSSSTPSTSQRGAVANDSALRPFAPGLARTLLGGAASIPDSGDDSLTRFDFSGWQIVSPSESPRIVATEVVNELIARVV